MLFCDCSISSLIFGIVEYLILSLRSLGLSGWFVHLAMGLLTVVRKNKRM